MEEIWKDIKGYEGKYQISNLGNVKSLNYANRGYEQNLVPKINNRGYLWVELRGNEKPKPVLIHRLVAEAFIENENAYPIINHKDENPQNCSVDNLEWCNNSYNVRYSLLKNGKLKLKPKGITGRKNMSYLNICIMQKSKNGELVKKWDNLVQIKHSLKINEWSIAECCRGKRKTAYGYKWEFA